MTPFLTSCHLDMMTPKGDGYLQQKFSASCPPNQGCGLTAITKETLGLRKIAEDLASGSDLA